ncbi:E2 ubiquitin-conjugating protein UBC1 ASCRUDRAFT_35544 [Ascoidea rubescens DSM 1968]|uniref:Ubiquitin-conjugating enzyme E2 1 n=1 Tax=Ascoidea rubescens DSM 1968 TaxID=1344418 RepID=A0A1D2VGR4_9ASCO|nr:hypothetical protein ASCRUDRAFT_35544 [Ascoidea rubescens DSM 1968]ODV60825.1 hypothetical protein ASCRUDRAFT_35544 [Ascoidea rubescens DSM 1968]
MIFSKRIYKELQAIEKDPYTKVSFSLVNPNDLTKLKGSFVGPPDTPYENGTFVVDIDVPSDYPFTPPKCKFDTKVYHPNISSQTGAICLDILSRTWSPIYTLESVLISLQQLLESPEPSDPQDAIVAEVYVKKKAEFDKTAREWTKKYATPKDTSPNSSNDELEYSGIEPATVEIFTSMGYPKDRVIQVLLDLDYKKINTSEDTKINSVFNALG